MLKFIGLLFLLLPGTLKASEVIRYSGSCRIYGQNGSIKAVFPGRECLFLDDGRLISLGHSGLKAFSKEGKVEWEYSLEGRGTSIEFTRDRKNFFLLWGKSLRIMNFKGETIHKLESTEAATGVSEIPQSKKLSGPSWLKSGNILISFPGKGISVYSPDLKKVLHTFQIKSSRDQRLNDFFVTKEGTFVSIIQESTETPPEAPGSVLEELNLGTGKVVSKFPSVPNGTFYLPTAGSVELLPRGDFLLTHPFSGAYFISRKEMKLLRFVTTFHNDVNGLRPPESVETYRLDRFLKNWKL